MGKQTTLQSQRPLFTSFASFPFNAFLPFSKWRFQLPPTPVRNILICPYLEKGFLWGRQIQVGCVSHPSTPPPPDTPQLLALQWHLCTSGSALEGALASEKQDFVVVTTSETDFREKRPGQIKAKESYKGKWDLNCIFQAVRILVSC